MKEGDQARALGMGVLGATWQSPPLAFFLVIKTFSLPEDTRYHPMPLRVKGNNPNGACFLY